MKIAAADDERLALNLLEAAIREAEPNAEVKAFLYQSELVAEIDSGFAPDVAFLDIEMPGMNGLELARHIKEKSPDTAIIFVTGYPEYAFEAYQMRAKSYVSKPVSTVKIREELEILKKEMKLPSTTGHIHVQCFGNFEIFVDGKPLSFSRGRSKELVAFLVDRRGSAVTMPEISAILWDDGLYDASRNSQIHNYLTDITKAIHAVGGEDILLRRRNSIAVNISSFNCDYYEYLSGNSTGTNGYKGEYMTQYSWAEFTTGALTSNYK